MAGPADKKPKAPSAPGRLSNKAAQAKTASRIGLTLISISFVCTLVIFSLLLSEQRRQEKDYTALKEKAAAVDLERKTATEAVATLEDRMGRSLSLEKLLTDSREEYGNDEAARRQGILWVDRAGGVLYVTLGAVQGLTPGMTLRVYDDQTYYADVRVDTPMDVISYVRPIGKRVDEFVKDYYRVVIE